MTLKYSLLTHVHSGENGELEQGSREALAERKHKGRVLAKKFLHRIL